MRQTTWILMCAVAALFFAAVFTAPDLLVAASKNKTGTASDLFARVDFENNLAQTAIPTGIQSDLEGADVPPEEVNKCGNFQYWDSTFDHTCQSSSGSGSMGGTVSNGGNLHLGTLGSSADDQNNPDLNNGMNNRFWVVKWKSTDAAFPCPNLDAVLYASPPPGAVVPPINPDECTDNLEAWSVGCHTQVFAPGATEDAVCLKPLGTRLGKKGNIQWAPFYVVNCIQPLFILEDPDHPGDPDYRIVSSRNPATGEDRSQADLIDTNNSPGAKDDEFKGTFYLPLEMKFRQVHCPPDGSECPPE